MAELSATDTIMNKNSDMANSLDMVIMEAIEKFKGNPNDEYLRRLLPYLAELRVDILKQNVNIAQMNTNKEDEEVVEYAKRSVANAKTNAYEVSDIIAKLSETVEKQYPGNIL